jgi:hypothetical protein
MELTIGSLSITIGPSGSSRLSDSTKPDPSANKSGIEEILESSEDSSSKVNSPVSFEKAPIAEGDKIRENFDSEERACQTHNNIKDFAMGSSGVSKVHQLCVIITEAEEENNNKGSKKVDRQVDKMKEHNKKEMEKIHVSAGEWRMIKSAINHGTEVPEGARREVLMGYQYALYQHRKKLREERDMVFQDNNSISREEYWGGYSEDSEYSRERHANPKHNRGATACSREERYSGSPTPQLEEEEDDFMQETPEAALVAAQAYFLTTRPEPGDPREDMHQAVIRSLEIVESKIREKVPETKLQAARKIKRRSSDTTSQIASTASHQKRKGDRRGKRMQEI